jgi:tellurite resistance protein TehA-like permease
MATVVETRPRPTVKDAQRSPSWLSTFHPGWFAAVMGTAVVGVASNLNPGNIAGLQAPMQDLAVGMVALAYLFTVALGIPYVVRWIRHPASALQDLIHPVVGALYATFPAGLLVLAAATAAVGPRIFPSQTVSTIVAVLAVPGSILALGIAVTFGYVLFLTPTIEPEQASGVWFIPPVVARFAPSQSRVSSRDMLTIRRLKTSSTTARYRKPDQVGT